MTAPHDSLMTVCFNFPREIGRKFYRWGYSRHSTKGYYRHISDNVDPNPPTLIIGMFPTAYNDAGTGPVILFMQYDSCPINSRIILQVIDTKFF